MYSKLSFGLDRKNWYSGYRYLSFAFLFITYLYLSASVYGSIYKKQIKNDGSIDIHFADGEVKKGKMIGKTKEVVFLLDGKQVEVIPISALVKTIKVPSD